MRLGFLAMLGTAALGLAACGPNAVTRATSGAAAGAVVAGPVGAVAGAALGASDTVQVRRPRGI